MNRKAQQSITPQVTDYRKTVASTLQCCISYNKYGGYCVPLSSRHRPAAKKILSGEVWEPETIHYMAQNCGAGDIIHAGTYFGDFLPALSQACAPEAKLWAFEPNWENYRCATITTLINDLRNVQIINAGLGTRQDSLPIKIADHQGQSLGGASYFITERNNHRKAQLATAEIVPIDEIVPANRNVSLLQLDVENYEQQALAGALRTIRRCKPILILENLPEESWLSKYILNLGYQVIGHVHANTILSAE